MLPTFSPAASASATPPPRPIPGSYGPPVIGALRDRLDYFWFQSQDEFFRRRAAANRSTVFRTNIPPTFPFFVGIDPRVVAVVDAAAFTALFDNNTLVDKRDILIGPYNPGAGFSGGTRVGVYLDTEEPEHERVKKFAMDILHRSSTTWASEFRAGVDAMLDAVEADLAAKAKDAAGGDKPSANYIVPLQQCIFRFLCKALVGADPKVDWVVDRFGFTILDVWLALQILPTQKIGIVQPLEELLIHSFPLPSFLIWPGYQRLYRFVEEHGAAAVAYAAEEHGIGKKDAINNILFVLGFNAFGGFSVFLPFLVAKIGESADPTGLRPRLREEVRAVMLRAAGGADAEFGFKAAREMPLVRSTVYEMLRMQPPVPLQFGRARKDFVLPRRRGVPGGQGRGAVRVPAAGDAGPGGVRPAGGVRAGEVPRRGGPGAAAAPLLVQRAGDRAAGGREQAVRRQGGCRGHGVHARRRALPPLRRLPGRGHLLHQARQAPAGAGHVGTGSSQSAMSN